MVGPRRFFLTYSRADAPEVEALARQLREFGQEAWLDQELSGGQKWWDTILLRIRSATA